MLSLLLVFNSCLQHLFKITVLEDGSVEYFYKVSGDSSDLYDKTTDLPLEAEWTIMRFTELDTTDDGVDTVYVLTAERTFAVNEVQFADNFSSREELLQHPLKIRKNDLFFITSYNFDFTFIGREMADLYGSEEDYLPEEIKSEEGELSDSMKAVQEAQIKEGYLNWGADFYWKRFNFAIQESREYTNIAEDSTFMLELEADLKAYLLSELPKFDLESDLNDEFIWPTISEGGYNLVAAAFQVDRQSELMVSVRKNAEFQQLCYSATNDLQDESFKIELEMPGIIKSNNADSTAGNLLVWEFDADAILDSTKHLSAVSIKYQYQFIFTAAAIIIIIVIIVLGRVLTRRKNNA